MYERFGFRPAGHRRRYYHDNGEDALIMWLEPTRPPRAHVLRDPRDRDLLRRHLRRGRRRRRGCSPTSSPRRPQLTRATAASCPRSPRATTSSWSTRWSTPRSPRPGVELGRRRRARGHPRAGPDRRAAGRRQHAPRRSRPRAGKPLVGVDHLHGHVAANFLEPEPLEPPFLCLIASGGHTLLAGGARATRASRCSARRSTTRPARRSTRPRACSASAIPGGPAIERAAARRRPGGVRVPGRDGARPAASTSASAA